MMDRFIGRENQLFDVLSTFNEEDRPFIVVGGYAVSAFQHRFSVDLDLVVQPDVLDTFVSVLGDNGFVKAEEKELDAYGGRFVAYEKDADLPVSIDFLVNGLQSRRTGASWSYEYIEQYAVNAEIQGTERAVETRIPEKELLIAFKLHSGRLTDARDVVALADAIDFDRVSDHLHRGDCGQLRVVLQRVRDTVTGEDFADAFKGVFSARELPAGQIGRVETFLEEQLAEGASQ